MPSSVHIGTITLALDTAHQPPVLAAWLRLGSEAGGRWPDPGGASSTERSAPVSEQRAWGVGAMREEMSLGAPRARDGCAVLVGGAEGHPKSRPQGREVGPRRAPPRPPQRDPQPTEPSEGQRQRESAREEGAEMERSSGGKREKESMHAPARAHAQVLFFVEGRGMGVGQSMLSTWRARLPVRQPRAGASS